MNDAVIGDALEVRGFGGRHSRGHFDAVTEIYARRDVLAIVWLNGPANFLHKSRLAHCTAPAATLLAGPSGCVLLAASLLAASLLAATLLACARPEPCPRADPQMYFATNAILRSE